MVAVRTASRQYGNFEQRRKTCVSRLQVRCSSTLRHVAWWTWSGSSYSPTYPIAKSPYAVNNMYNSLPQPWWQQIRTLDICVFPHSGCVPSHSKFPLPSGTYSLSLYNSHVHYSNTVTMISGLSLSCGWDAHELTQDEEGHLLGWFCSSTAIYPGSCWLLHTLISRVDSPNGVSAFFKNSSIFGKWVGLIFFCTRLEVTFITSLNYYHIMVTFSNFRCN